MPTPGHPEERDRLIRQLLPVHCKIPRITLNLDRATLVRLRQYNSSDLLNTMRCVGKHQNGILGYDIREVTNEMHLYITPEHYAEMLKDRELSRLTSALQFPHECTVQRSRCVVWADGSPIQDADFTSNPSKYLTQWQKGTELDIKSIQYKDRKILLSFDNDLAAFLACETYLCIGAVEGGKDKFSCLNCGGKHQTEDPACTDEIVVRHRKDCKASGQPSWARRFTFSKGPVFPKRLQSTKPSASEFLRPDATFSTPRPGSPGIYLGPDVTGSSAASAATTGPPSQDPSTRGSISRPVVTGAIPQNDGKPTHPFFTLNRLCKPSEQGVAPSAPVLLAKRKRGRPSKVASQSGTSVPVSPSQDASPTKKQYTRMVAASEQPVLFAPIPKDVFTDSVSSASSWLPVRSFNKTLPTAPSHNRRGSW
ncbi:hypothetical protein ACEQ8H_008969 [Pleosporales sp. CAS-2024a]